MSSLLSQNSITISKTRLILFRSFEVGREDRLRRLFRVGPKRVPRSRPIKGDGLPLGYRLQDSSSQGSLGWMI